MDPAQFSSIISFCVYLGIFIGVLVQYIKYGYRSLLYLLLSVFLLALGDFNSIFVYNQSFAFSLQGMAESLTYAIGAMFCLLLFFNSFVHESPYTRINVILLVLVTITAAGLLTVTLMMLQLQDVLFSDIPGGDLLILSDLTNLHPAAVVLIETTSIFLFIAYGLIILEFTMIFRHIRTRKQGAREARLRTLLNRMQLGCVFIIIGISLAAFDPLVSLFIQLPGMVFVFGIYLISGVLLLQEETLRRLIVIDNTGIPVYQYTFREFEGLDRNRVEDKDGVMFSGALNATSSFLAELTGRLQSIREIKLDETNLLLQPTSNGSHSVLLVVDRTAKFFFEALKEFVTRIEDILKELSPNSPMNPDQSDFSDKLVELVFGFSPDSK